MVELLLDLTRMMCILSLLVVFGACVHRAVVAWRRGTPEDLEIPFRHVVPAWVWAFLAGSCVALVALTLWKYIA